MHREHPDARGAWQEEDGFTLLELMMVIMIIGILIAVLAPVFLGATTRARDRALQTNLTTALTAAKVVYNDKTDYTLATPAALTTEAGALTFVVGNVAPATPTAISVLPVTQAQLVLAGYSKSGNCFYILDDETGAGTRYAKLPGAGGCAANGAPLPADVAWKSTW